MMRYLACLISLFTACSSSEQTVDAGGQPDMNHGETCVSDGLKVALAPHYAIKVKLAVNLRVPAGCAGDTCIFDADAQAGLLLLADVTQTGTSASLVARACQLDIPPVALKGQLTPTQMYVPDDVMRSVAPVLAAALLEGDTTCAAFSSDLIPIYIGCRLADVVHDPLPAFHASEAPPVKFCDGVAAARCDMSSDLACICDQEGDSKPGATLTAQGIPVLDDIDQVYVGLRVLLQLDGAIFPPLPEQPTFGQRVRGQIRNFALEQSPVGCHRKGTGGAGYDCDSSTVNAIVALNPAHRQSVNTPSTFVALPVDELLDCDGLKAQADLLFQGQ